MDLAAVIAPNGLGHFRRVVRQLDALLTDLPKLRIGLICETWQLEATRGWQPLSRVLAANSTVVTGPFEGAFRWSNASSDFDERRLNGWLGELDRVDWLKTAQRVLSDNLVGVLELRPDAVLGGSFLWSDVLEPLGPTNVAVARFVERERALLRAHQPKMLCVRELAMPGVVRQTQAVLLPWMCEWATKRSSIDKPSACVGVLGGATGTAAAFMTEIVRSLIADPRLEIRVEKTTKARDFPNAPRVEAFSHDEAGYNSLSLAFVRPGVGTLTDCVSAQVPMIVLDEPENFEMAHNARAIVQLGLGELLARSESTAALSIAQRCLEEGAWRSRVEAFRPLARTGLKEAADWLVRWIRI
jgi:hypothetical protein